MKKILLLSLLIIGICVILIGCGAETKISAGTKNYDIVKTEGYYKDLKMNINGQFLVRNKIEESVANESGVVYKVDLNIDKKIEKITAMYAGYPIDTVWSDMLNNHYFKFSIITVEYQDGYEKYNFKNSLMKSASGFYGAYSIRYKVDDKKRHKVAYLYNKNGEQSKNGDGYAQLFFTYDDKENLYKVGYANANGERITTTKKQYEIRFKYDNTIISGLPIEVANYNKDDSLAVDHTGVAKTVYKFDDKGRIIETKNYGTDETLKEKNELRFYSTQPKYVNMNAGAITKYIYDGDNNEPSRLTFYGKDEQAIGIKDCENISSIKFKYTAEGLISEVSTFGTDGSPIPINKRIDGNKVVKIRMAYDSYGNPNTITYLGWDDNMVISSDERAAEIRVKFDDKRRYTEQTYWGTDGDKIEIKWDKFLVHRLMFEYNDDDEIILMVLYNKSDVEINRYDKSNSK